MNKVTLLGRLTSDPELQKTQSGISTVRFCVAVNRRFRKQQGVYDADFINCLAWRHTAEFLCKYFKKGSSIAVCGSIQTSSWDDTDDKRHYKTEVVADEVYFAGDSKTNGQAQNNAPQEPQQAQQTTQQDMFTEFAVSTDLNEDDLPF